MDMLERIQQMEKELFDLEELRDDERRAQRVRNYTYAMKDWNKDAAAEKIAKLEKELEVTLALNVKAAAHWTHIQFFLDTRDYNAIFDFLEEIGFRVRGDDLMDCDSDDSD